MPTLLWNILAVCAVIFLIPILVYGAFSALFNLKPPDEVSPSKFLFSTLIEKLGVAVAFVLLYTLAARVLEGRWLAYAAIWWVLFVFGEFGRKIGSNYSWKEVFAGIISESIYLPVSAYLLSLTPWITTL